MEITDRLSRSRSGANRSQPGLRWPAQRRAVLRPPATLAPKRGQRRAGAEEGSELWPPEVSPGPRSPTGSSDGLHTLSPGRPECPHSPGDKARGQRGDRPSATAGSPQTSASPPLPFTREPHFLFGPHLGNFLGAGPQHPKLFHHKGLMPLPEAAASHHPGASPADPISPFSHQKAHSCRPGPLKTLDASRPPCACCFPFRISPSSSLQS